MNRGSFLSTSESKSAPLPRPGEKYERHMVDNKSRSSDAEEFASYSSNAKVFLIGLGADELLAGYGRHRSVFHKGSWEALRQELNKDFARLWHRNLARDDRMIASKGREARHPYLDHRLLQFLQKAPLDHICDMTLPPGEGDKLLLRMVAWELGVKKHATLVKRAMQFGTRLANPKVPGQQPIADDHSAPHSASAIYEKGNGKLTSL